jgi:hypothetical protein
MGAKIRSKFVRNTFLSPLQNVSPLFRGEEGGGEERHYQSVESHLTFHSLTQFPSNLLLSSREPIQTRLFCRRMAQLEQLDWAHLLGSPFALAVAPFLSNRELFKLSACSRKVLRLRYDLGRWSVELNDTSYESFRIKRHSVPPCFEGRASFDLVTYLGSRLSVRMRTRANVQNVDALAGVHSLDLRDCTGITDVSTLGGVHTLDLSGCTGITDVSALGGVHTLGLIGCIGITDVSALGGVQTLSLRECTGIVSVRRPLRPLHLVLRTLLTVT